MIQQCRHKYFNQTGKDTGAEKGGRLQKQGSPTEIPISEHIAFICKKSKDNRAAPCYGISEGNPAITKRNKHGIDDKVDQCGCGAENQIQYNFFFLIQPYSQASPSRSIYSFAI